MDTTNKPVAWIDPYDLERLPHHDCWVNGQEHKNSVPLYTHPSEHDLGIADAIGFDRGYKAATVKELTDEEIEGWIVAWAKDLYKTLYVEPTDHQRTMAIKMARAILRKAQEK